MTLSITHQEHYSRSELLLRSLFGNIYILFPHGFLLFFVGLWGIILMVVAFFAILFTKKYPKNIFTYQVNLMRWKLRVNNRTLNLSDGYPAFGLSATDEGYSTFEVPYPEKINRGLVILRFFFGSIYVGIPHGIILLIRTIIGVLLTFLSWFTVLFTKKYPEGWHTFMVETIRWQYRVAVYLFYMSDTYPPFSGKDGV